MFAWLKYIVACQWYTVRFCFYTLHAALVFIVRPGVPLAVAVLCGIGFFAGGSVEQSLASTALESMFSSLRFIASFMISDELVDALYSLRWGVVALIVLTGLLVVLVVLSALFRPLVSALGVPKRPLPPLMPLLAPDTEVYPVTVTRMIGQGDFPPLADGLDTLSKTLPSPLADLLVVKSTASRRAAANARPGAGLRASSPQSTAPTIVPAAQGSARPARPVMPQPGGQSPKP